MGSILWIPAKLSINFVWAHARTLLQINKSLHFYFFYSSRWKLVVLLAEITVTFLGSGDAFAPKRYWNSILLEDSILLDVSPIVLPHLKKLNKRVNTIEYIFITHLHGDHFLGVPFLYLEYYFRTPRVNPLNIIGPLGLKPKIEESFMLCYPDVAKNLKRPFKVKYFEIPYSGKNEVGDIAFEVLEMKHFIPTFGYKIHIHGKTVAYSGDTEVCEGLYELAHNVDILILEASFAKGSHKGHLSVDEISKLRNEISKKTRVIITHLGEISCTPRDVLVAEDLKTFKF